MFYSQFILAKKGPLGTIWIAAHLERKLRKNQVADTDIGVSVDSILFPEVPIALRLSSHLLLGVVRIYNRKVNYLFDDCSEALLKVKQAFRSTAVDLPPEESKAPYNSITLPEKFDLDDFELPDSDVFQGNYVDHHISSREQITLQDTMEGVSYSTSKFGLDERFGDGDASGLDLDEELFLNKIGTAGDADESADPQASYRSMTPDKRDEHPEDRATNSETMAHGADEPADLMDYAQAPRTPGLQEEPNLSNAKDASTCDDHLESEYHLMEPTIRENENNVPYEDKQEVDWSSRDDTISVAVPQVQHEENGFLSSGLEIKESKSQEESPIKGQDEAIRPTSELTDRIETSDVPLQEDSPIEAVKEDKTFFLLVVETSDNHQGPNEVGLEKSAADTSGLASTAQQVFECVSAKDLASPAVEVPNCVGDTSNKQKSCDDCSELALENQDGFFLETPETHACQETTNSLNLEAHDKEVAGETTNSLNLVSPVVEVPNCVGDTSNQQKSCDDCSELALENQVGFFQETPETHACQETTNSLNLEAHDKEVAGVTLVSGQCNSVVEQSDVTKPGDSISTDADVKSDTAALATYGREETMEPGKEYCITSNSEQSLKGNEIQEHASGEDIQVAIGEADPQVHNTNSQDKLVENLNNSTEPELPAPEKLLSVPEGHMDSHRDMLVEVSPSEFEGLDVGDAGSKSAVGKKRSFTESTLTEQSLNSVESSRQVRVKRTTGSVPDDDDLLSSILVGRKSSVLKLKPTPPLTEVTSMKRTRAVLRSGGPKRKVLMDDTMVLHGDTIRQQLTNVEDIRRVRKKAPCTLDEISTIQKQHMNDESFLGTIFTGVSVELASLHSQAYDLSLISVCKDDVNGASLETVTEARQPSQDDKNDASLETIFEPNIASMDDKYVDSLETVAGLHLSSPNNENHDKGPGTNNVIEISEQGVNNELLTVRDNEIIEPSENPLPSENRLEEVNYSSMDVNFSQEQTKPTNDVEPNNSQVIPEVEPLDPTGHGTSDVGDASAGMVQTDSLNEFVERSSHVNMDASDVVPDQTMSLLSVELDYADIDDGHAIDRNEVAEKDEDGNRDGEIELGAKDDILPDVVQDAVEIVPDVNHGELDHNLQNGIYNTTFEEQREVEFSHEALVSVPEDGSMNNGENPNHSEAYQPNMMDAEISGFDLHDRDDINYSAAGNDTEFLNVDDDELTEIADDHMPDDEETRYTENSGWSSRTRAVSKYLQGAFANEAVCGRKSLSMDNLLSGKSRKEASRMFFETLVLKTRDYIHVEQQNPYNDITIKPRTKLMKSDF